MRIKTTGKVTENFFIAGLPQFPVYVLNGKYPVLFEAGIAASADISIKSVKELLAGREPSLLLLTHVHWDHCGGVSELKKAFPNMQVCASSAAAGIMKKPNAIALMDRLNAEAFDEVHAEGLNKSRFAAFDVDVELAEGMLPMDTDEPIDVIATPGHTRDHLSYYLPQSKILIAGEAAGALNPDESMVQPEFLIDYGVYKQSMERIAALPAETLCQCHRIVFTGRGEVEEFFARAKSDLENFARLVFYFADETGGDVDEIMSRVKQKQYDPLPFPKQTESSYLINLEVRVKHLLANRQVIEMEIKK